MAFMSTTRGLERSKLKPMSSKAGTPNARRELALSLVVKGGVEGATEVGRSTKS